MTIEENTKVVTVRWWDGYIETFNTRKARAGAYMLWMVLTNGEERRIPLQQVRWYKFAEIGTTAINTTNELMKHQLGFCKTCGSTTHLYSRYCSGCGRTVTMCNILGDTSDDKGECK